MTSHTAVGLDKSSKPDIQTDADVLPASVVNILRHPGRPVPCSAVHLRMCRNDACEIRLGQSQGFLNLGVLRLVSRGFAIPGLG
jgi:hypothetical protein